MAPKYNRDTLLKDLRENVVDVRYIKVDGTVVVRRATLRSDLLPSEHDAESDAAEKTFHTQNPDVINYWDIGASGWRAFRIENVQYAEIVDHF